MNRIRRERRPAMQVEALEHRAMLAGDVTVTVSDGNIFITGDAEANEIAIASGERPGQVFVSGLPSPSGVATTVNGMTGRVLFEGVRFNVTVRMGEGNDVIRVPHLRVPGDLSVATGEGDDRVIVGMPPDPAQPNQPQGVHARGTFHLATGLGDDVVIEHRVFVGGMHRLETGPGADEVMIGSPPGSNPGVPVPPALTAAVAVISLGEDHDVLRVHGAVLGQELGVSGGSGDDHVRLDQVAASRAIRVSGGEGDDHLGLSHLRTGLLALHAAEGQDRASIMDAALGGLRVDMGHGDDQLAIGNLTIPGRAILVGGRGDDILVNHGGNRMTFTLVVGFEHIRSPMTASESEDTDPTDLAGVLT